jgi:hypothetical protein
VEDGEHRFDKRPETVWGGLVVLGIPRRIRNNS